MTTASPSEPELHASRNDMLIDILAFMVLAFLVMGMEYWIAPPATFSGFISITGWFLTVVIICRMRGQRFASLGFKKPEKMTTFPLWVIGIFLASTTLGGAAQIAAMQVFDAPINLDKFQALHQNLPMLVFALISIWITAALFEEVIFRGFLLARLADVMGPGKAKATVAVLIHAALFGILHAYQGPLGVITTGVIAIVFGASFLIQRRNLWALILVHGSIDTIGVIQFYLNGVPAVAAG